MKEGALFQLLEQLGRCTLRSAVLQVEDCVTYQYVASM